MEGCGSESEEAEGVGLEQLSLLQAWVTPSHRQVVWQHLAFGSSLCTLPPTGRVSLFPPDFPGSHAVAGACAEQAMLCCSCCWVGWRHPEIQALDSLSVGITSQLTSAKPCDE